MEQNLKKNLFVNILASPFLLAVPMAIAIIFILPDFGSKYQLDLVSSRLSDKEKSKIDFVDLNSDGIDEQVSGFPNIAMGKAAIKVMTHDFVNYDQWNFNGKYKKLSDYFYVADLDKNGLSEIYTIYHRNDSLFLAAVAPYPDKRILFEDKLVTVFKFGESQIDYEIRGFNSVDLNHDSYPEFVFLVNAGFSLQPRMICAYDRKNDSLIRSQTYGANIAISEIADLNEDGYPEFYTDSHTRKNIADSMGVPYSDYHSWLMVFDHQLRFRFKPIKHEGAFSNVMTYPVKERFEEPAILSLFIHKTNNKYFLKKISPMGELLEEVDLKQVIDDISSFNPGFFKVDIADKETLIVIGSMDENLLFAEKDLTLSKLKATSNIRDYLFSKDLNSDGVTEHIFRNNENGITVFDKNLKNPVDFVLNLQTPKHYYLSVGVKSGPQEKELFVKTDYRVYFLSYSKNPLFYVKYLIWIFVYIAMAMALWGAQYLRQRQVQRRIELESTITQLQMKTIKSQMDPHFIFNVLNGIANNIHNRRNTESYNQIVRFSRLLRILMKRSETINVTLKEEMEFVLHYLELEKFRFKDNFSYAINIDEDVDQHYKIPKMLIQLLVENAIKHGLHEKTGLKHIAIAIFNADNQLKIVVKDNGVGREAARMRNPEIGKGYSLLDELAKLNKDLHGQNISINIMDLMDENYIAGGTRVEATVI
ncbi:MAG: histidine kinase [Bacteroidales bacterium]|nr:histidine kinase [Bacteroidales bacterium]MCF8334153.1 histidine kinase [Bacteroidales bacterium]